MKCLLFDSLRKIERKIKSFFKFWKVSFIDADFRHYGLILDFLMTHREPENYLIFLLKNLLSSANSQKIIYSNTIALAADKIIGFDFRIFFPNHYYWGSAVTVHPRFRQLGVARHLIEIGEKAASKMNINKVRHVNIFSNISVFKKLGYNEIRPWYIVGYKLTKTGAVDSKSPGVREAVDSDSERLEQFLSKSEYFILSGEMYAEDLIWYPLDRLRLGDLIKQGKVLLSEDKSGIRGVSIINKKSLINPFPSDNFSIMEIGYFDGDWAVILDFIQKKYRPDFLRIYSANGIPLKCLPKGIQNGYFSKSFNDLFGGLDRLNPPVGKLFFTSVMLMQKIISS